MLKKMLRNKQIVLSGLVMIIVIAGAVNWAMQNAKNEVIPASGDIMEMEDAYFVPIDDDDVVEQADTFADTRISRDSTRGKELDINREIVDNPNTSIEAKNEAQKEMKRIAEAIESESIIESLIKSKGFEQAVVLISKDNVNAVVKANGLTPAQVAQIKDIIIQKTSFTADKIRISEVK